jgi:hypothetical protein
MQGKKMSTSVSYSTGDTLGIFYSWRSKQLLFTKNRDIGRGYKAHFYTTVHTIGVARGAYIPKISIGKETKISYNFGPRYVAWFYPYLMMRFTFGIEELCSRLRIEIPIKHDESLQFWQQAIKSKILARFSKSLTEEELKRYERHHCDQNNQPRELARFGRFEKNGIPPLLVDRDKVKQ